MAEAVPATNLILLAPLELLREQDAWSGSASELLDAVGERASDQMKRSKSWPRNGRSMASHLKRLSPNLRAAGWEVDNVRQASRRLWTFRHRDGTPPAMTQPAPGRDASAMLFDAESCDSYRNDADDANDANDANRQLQMEGREQNGSDYEEGQI